MLTFFQAITLGLLQGVTELFPISSLGHSVIIPSLLGWRVDQKDPFFLSFLVATHLATALTLFAFYWRDWLRIVAGMWSSLIARSIAPQNADGQLGWSLVIATIPAGLLGVLFEEQAKALFASPHIAAGFLFLNGGLLFAAEYLRRRAKRAATPATLGFFCAFKIGCMQCLALLPGFSRTGATLSGGLWEGLSHDDAARFSFLMATPIIGAAAVLKLPELWSAGSAAIIIALAGALAAAIAAYLSIRFLTAYFRTRTLIPFAWYCLLAGAFAFFLT